MQTDMSFKHVALILIDYQHIFMDVQRRQGVPTTLETFPDIPNKVQNLISTAKSSGIDIIHVHANYTGTTCSWIETMKSVTGADNYPDIIPDDNGGHGSAMPWASPSPGETIIRKNTFDCFLGTELENVLKEKGKKLLVFAGVATSCCVLFSVNGAFARGFRTAVVGDACGEALKERHDGCLKTYGSYLFHNITTEGFLNFVKSQLKHLS